MTVRDAVPTRVSVSPLPHIGLPDWKLGLPQKRPDPQDDRQNHRSSTQRRSGERDERRESSGRQKRANHKSKSHKGRDHVKRRKDPQQQQQQQQQTQEQQNPERHRKSERRSRPPQHEIEFVKDTTVLKDPYTTKPTTNNTKRTETSAENVLFSFPWKWPGEIAKSPAAAAAGRDNKRETGVSDIGVEASERIKGIPSVIFAVKGNEGDGPSVTASSIGASIPIYNHPPKQRAAKTRAPTPVAPPVKARHMPTENEERPKQHLKRRLMQLKYEHRVRKGLLHDEDSNDPIAPTPQVPILVGGREDPIPCSESLIDSVHRRYTAGRGGDKHKKRPPNYRRTGPMQKQSMHDLTGLESVSTYELEQRYMVNEVQTILGNAKRGQNDKDQIALPKLTHTTPANGYGNNTHPSMNGRGSGIPLSVPKIPKRVSNNPPERIGGHIVYNLSNASQDRQAKVQASIKAHTASISDSLEKMRFNLRQKQSVLSHAVFDMKARQKQEEHLHIQDRLRNNLNVSQRNPDTVPLLKNQNYISDIFKDIGSKMTHNQSERPKVPDTQEGRYKEPYVPRVGGILQARREQERISRTTRNVRDEGDVTPFDESPPRQRPGGKQPIKKRPNIDPSLESATLHQSHVRPNITSIDIQDHCDITSPITEQFSHFMTPQHTPSSKHPSLYLPNIRSKHTYNSTPMADAKLPFRPGNANYPAVQDVIDVTSAASLRFKKFLDVTDQASKGPSVAACGKKHSTQTHKEIVADLIDVTSVSSSKLGETTVKSITCVDEDSRGHIRTKRKLSAIPKHRKHEKHDRRKGPPPTKSTGKRRVGARIPYDLRYDQDVGFESNYANAEGQNGYANVENRRKSHPYDDQEEQEIVFEESPTANQGLFENIWDVEGQHDSIYLQEFPARESAIVPPRPYLGDQNYSLEMQGPLHMSRYGQDKQGSLLASGLFTGATPARYQLQQPPQKQEENYIIRSPMEASAAGGPMMRGDSPRGRSPSPLGRAPGRVLGRGSSPIGRGSSPVARAPSRLAISSSPNKGVGANLTRDPSAIPWTARQFPSLFRRKDAPIDVGKTPREPEGSVITAQDGLVDSTEESEETTEESDETKESPDHELVRPTPVRRSSALHKKKESSERSTGTRSVTFQKGDTLLGPKEETVPSFICADIANEISWSPSNKSVRANVHPWDKESQCSSREAFHDLSTRKKRQLTEEEETKRRKELFEKAEAKLKGVSKLKHREPSGKGGTNKGSKGSNSSRRSMYDEVLDATGRPQELIVLDAVEGSTRTSQEYETFPADAFADKRRHQQHNKASLWAEACNSINQSCNSHGQHWETLGDGSASRARHDKLSKASSRRSEQREGTPRERDCRDNGMFFDFLCF